MAANPKEQRLLEAMWIRIRPLLPVHPVHNRGGLPFVDDFRCFCGIVFQLRNAVKMDYHVIGFCSITSHDEGISLSLGKHREESFQHGRAQEVWVDVGEPGEFHARVMTRAAGGSQRPALIALDRKGTVNVLETQPAG